MFPCFEFKKSLGLAYIANLNHIIKGQNGGAGILSLGVQLLTIEDIILTITKDVNLKKNPTFIGFRKATLTILVRPKKEAKSNSTHDYQREIRTFIFELQRPLDSI